MKDLTDTEILDWLADNDIIEGFVGVADDIYDLSFHIAMERGAGEDEEPTADDKRKALRILIERAEAVEAALAAESEAK